MDVRKWLKEIFEMEQDIDRALYLGMIIRKVEKELKIRIL